MNQGYQQNNVTYIEDLPELDDLEQGQGPQPFQPAVRNHLRGSKYPGAGVLPPGEEHKFQKFIRGGHSTPMEAGMNSDNLGPPPSSESSTHFAVPHIKENTEQRSPKAYNMPENSPSCIEFYEHAANCPICSKYYNNDKTVYIIAIVVLSVIVMLLLKRVLDV